MEEEKVRSGALESAKRSSRRIGRRSRTVLGVEEEAAAGACRRQGAVGGAGGAAGGAGIGEVGSLGFCGSNRLRCRIPWGKKAGLCAHAPPPAVWRKSVVELSSSVRGPNSVICSFRPGSTIFGFLLKKFFSDRARLTRWDRELPKKLTRVYML